MNFHNFSISQLIDNFLNFNLLCLEIVLWLPRDTKLANIRRCTYLFVNLKRSTEEAQLAKI